MVSICSQLFFQIGVLISKFHGLFIDFQMQFMLLFSRQGKLRLQKWYSAQPDKAKKKITRDLVATILTRKPKMCSFLEWRELKVVYKRWVNWVWVATVIMSCTAVVSTNHQLNWRKQRIFNREMFSLNFTMFHLYNLKMIEVFKLSTFQPRNQEILTNLQE